MLKSKDSKQVNTVTEEEVSEIIALCEKYRDELTQYCRSFFGCEHAYAQDCVQNVYVALYESLRKGINIGDYKAWLYTVTRNYANKTLKDRIKRNEYIFESEQHKDDVINNALFYNPDYLNLMVTDDVIDERAEKIIADLTDDERRLFELHYSENISLKQIAEMLGISYTAVRKRHQTLRRKIEKAVKEYDTP